MKRCKDITCALLVLSASAGRGQEPSPQPTPAPRFRDSATVERLVVDVRVVDGSGRAVTGLAPMNFQVKVGGAAVVVESAVWMGPPDLDVVVTPERVPESPVRRSPEPRLVVFLLHKDLDPAHSAGLFRMVSKAESLFAMLAPGDQAAALLFDTHLRPLQDFTDDRARLRRAFRAGVMDGRIAEQERAEPSLFAHLDPAVAEAAASPELALQAIGEALETVPGAKTMVFLGGGMGRLSRLGVSMTPEYAPAVRALQQARCSVFALDITDVDNHSLEAGLIHIAVDTGGFYAKTHISAAGAIERTQRALAGYYVLSFPRPEDKPGPRQLEVGLKGKKGDVLAPTVIG